MTNSLISIIVPVYNVEKYLPKCLESIINQSYKNIEIILIDDGSTDKSGFICDEYRLKDDRIKVIHQTNHGIGYTRNRGLECAKGDYIGFVDSDDFIDENMFFYLHDIISHNNADIACCSSYRIELDKSIRICYNNFQDQSNFLNDDIFENYLKCIFGFMLWNKLFRTSLIKDIRFPLTPIGEDLWFLLQSFYLAQKVSCINIPLYYYVKRGTSLTEVQKKNDIDKTMTLFKINNKIFNFIKEKKPKVLPLVVNNYVKYLTELYQSVCLDGQFDTLRKQILNELFNNNDIIKKNCVIKGSKKIKINCLLYCNALFPLLAYYEKYIGGIEKKIRKNFKKRK